MKKKKSRSKALFFLEEQTRNTLDCYMDLLNEIFDVHIPKTGSEALELLRNHEFKIIFLGIMMPKGKKFPTDVSCCETGVYIIKEIKKALNKNRNALLVVLSSSAVPDSIKYAKHWADVYLESPEGERTISRLLDLF